MNDGKLRALLASMEGTEVVKDIVASAAEPKAAPKRPAGRSRKGRLAVAKAAPCKDMELEAEHQTNFFALRDAAVGYMMKIDRPQSAKVKAMSQLANAPFHDIFETFLTFPRPSEVE